MRIILIILFSTLNCFAFNKSRTAFSELDEVTDVRTALGIATKILLTENPTATPIVGDLSAFRIESIPKGYAVKPLRFGAKTNFFISVEDRTYVVRLTTVNQEQADYIVYIKPKVYKDKTDFIYRDFKRVQKNDLLTVVTKRVGKSRTGFVVIEFSIASKSKEYLEFTEFRLRQGQETKLIQSLILSSKIVEQNKPIVGALSIKLSDLKSEVPAILEVNHKLLLKVELSRDVLWRK